MTGLITSLGHFLLAAFRSHRAGAAVDAAPDKADASAPIGPVLKLAIARKKDKRGRSRPISRRRPAPIERGGDVAETAKRPSFDYRGLSKLVRAKIDERGMGYRGAAAEIGVTASDLSRIGGAQGITFEKVVAICDWLGTDPRDLYVGPSVSRAAPQAAPAGPPTGRGTSPDARSGLPAAPEPMKSNCCSAAHVKQASAEDSAEGRKPDRASGLMARPAGAAGAAGAEQPREAEQ